MKVKDFPEELIDTIIEISFRIRKRRVVLHRYKATENRSDLYTIKTFHCLKTFNFLNDGEWEIAPTTQKEFNEKVWHSNLSNALELLLAHPFNEDHALASNV